MDQQMPMTDRTREAWSVTRAMSLWVGRTLAKDTRRAMAASDLKVRIARAASVRHVPPAAHLGEFSGDRASNPTP